MAQNEINRKWSESDAKWSQRDKKKEIERQNDCKTYIKWQQRQREIRNRDKKGPQKGKKWP